MLIDTKNRQLFKRDEDLFDFARAYLSEAFPNPERAGCPQDKVLSSFARNPRQSDPSIADHVTCCSPCFNVYTVHLEQARADAKQARHTTRTAWIRWSLVSVSIAIVLLIVAYALLMKPQNEPSTTHSSPAPISQPAASAQTPVASVRVLLDLTTAAPQRGHQPRSQARTQPIPTEQIDLTLRLPIGSEAGTYTVSLISHRRMRWSAVDRLRIENGEPVLNMRADFSRIPDGKYELQVASKGQHLGLPIVIARPSDKPR